MIIGVDLGNKSRNSIAVMDEQNNLIEYSRLKYDGSISVWQHRKNICKQIQEYIDKYSLTKNDYLVFEQIFFSRGLSRMANVTSMAFLQATIINEFSEQISICEVHVQSWKSKVLGSRSATKDDAVKYVEEHYPQVNLNIIIPHKRKEDELVKDNDTADAICIAVYGNIAKEKLKLVNYT